MSVRMAPAARPAGEPVLRPAVARATRVAALAAALLAAVLALSACAAPLSGQSASALSWTSDRLPLRVGDQITLLVDELTLAEATRDDAALRERERDLSVRIGAGGTNQGGSLRTGNDVARSESGSSARRERFTSQLGVRVVELGDGGSARVEGSRKVVIDEHEQEILVSGWIRSQDVAFDNTIESWRLADAEIRYASNGALVKSPGFWSRIFDLVVP